MESIQKTCLECKETKSIFDFYKHSRMLDGHLNQCIECVKNRVKRHREENIESIRAYDRKRGALPHRLEAVKIYQKGAGREKSNKAKQAYTRRYQDRKAAHTICSNAVRDGKIIRQECWICGERAEMHHVAYDYPLAVSWLCKKHHTQLHKEHRQYLRDLNE